MTATTHKPLHVDAIVIGAGFSGLRMLYELRRLGLSARVIEAGSDLGGTWYWNRYPGSRTDSESWYYCFSFCKELLQEWDWSQRFTPYDEILKYLDHVAQRFDLRKDMVFNQRVLSAHYDQTSNLWTVTSDSGDVYQCRYFILGSGAVSQPHLPVKQGLEQYCGEVYMTARWPKHEVDFSGKRVGIIGTGASAVVAIPVIAQTAAHLTVFQRTPNYVLPSRNYPLQDADRKAIKADYDKIWARVNEHPFGMAFEFAGRVLADVPPEQRQRIFDKGWETGGFRFMFETFDDIWLNEESNQAAAEYVRNKIRTIVDDPDTAELLCPKNHPLGSKRPPVGQFYYETFNRDNVTLVDVHDNPLRGFTATGVRTDSAQYDLDIVIAATGFDMSTGAPKAIDIRGRDGRTLVEHWQDGPRTLLGLAVDGFPNMFVIYTAQMPFSNVPPVIERQVEWIGRALEYFIAQGIEYVEPAPSAVEQWCQHVDQLVGTTLLQQGERANSWIFGANIPGKARKVLFYFGGANRYYDEISHCAEHGYQGFLRDERGQRRA